MDLWTADNSHPSFKGSYLAACMFYVVIFHDSPVGLPYIGTLSVADATFLQHMANRVMISDLSMSRRF